jgi:endonuclease/exonuclease/phosphatase family metal-dependent hydrolase
MDETTATSEMRVATLNLWGRRGAWEERRRVLAEGFRELAPDLVAFQEAVVGDGYDQVADILGPGYHVVHQTDREAGRGGDLDATPDAASVRFLRGRQSLRGLSLCYRDAWGSTHPGQEGHTFAAENPLVTAENWDWELELGRRIDYVMVRCSDHGPTLDVRACQRIFDEPADGVWASDHFGVVADLSAQTSSGRPVH